MTQLSLFADLTNSLPANPTVVVPVIATKNAVSTPKPVQVAKAEQDSLLRLAELIRDGRAQMEARTQARSRPIQSIGELAQAVLQRHDLVARRRAKAVQQAAMTEIQTGSPALTCLPVVGLAQTPSQVHVAS
jgi:hypothetical protein